MSVITNLLSANNFIVTNKVLAKSIGLNEAIIFAELCGKHNFFTENSKLDSEGFFYCTAATLQEETTLTTRQQSPVLEKLEKLGFITTKLKGNPARKHYKISHENELNFVKSMQRFESDSFNKMSNQVLTKCRNKDAQNVETEFDKMSKLDSTKCRTNKTNNNTKYKTNTNINIPKTDFDKSVLADLNELEVFEKVEISETPQNTTPHTPLEAEEKKEKKVPPKKEKKVDEVKAAKEAEKAKQDLKFRTHLHSEFIEIYDKWHEGLKGERIPDVFWKQHVRAMASIREKFIPLSEQKLPSIGMEATDENITKGFATFLDNLKKSLTPHEVGKMTPRFLELNLLEFLEKVRNNHVNNNRKSINNSQQQLVNKYFTGAGKATV